MTNKETNHTDTLVFWNAPVRPFKKRDRVFYQTIVALAFLLIVISFFLREWLLIGSILAVVFVSYVLAAVPPPNIVNKITKKGIWVGESFFRFEELSQYWFEFQLENVVLIVLHKSGTRVVLVVPQEKKNKVDNVIREKLVFREKPLKSAIDALAGWLKEKFPFEETTSSQRSDKKK